MRRMFAAVLGLLGAMHFHESPSQIIDPFTPFPSGSVVLYLSLETDTTLTGLGPGGADLVVTGEDIISWNGANYAMVFDGSAAGLPDTDIAAFDIDTAGNRILMTFRANTSLAAAIMDTEVALTVAGSDVVAYSPSTGKFTWIFDGSDVGLTGSPGEFVDALQQLSDGRFVVSIQGDGTVNTDYPNDATTITLLDEDIGVFTPTALGSVTTGSWAMYFDGSDVELTNNAESTEDIDGVSVVTGNVYLSTVGNYVVTGASGAGDDVFVCQGATTGVNTACTGYVLFFDGSAHGLTGVNVDAIDLP